MLAQACGGVETPSVNTLDGPAPFKPPLSLSHAVVSWLNEIGAQRILLRSHLGDKALSVRMTRLVWQAEPSAISMLDCVFGVGDDTVVLSLPRPLAETLISTVQNGLTLPSDPTRSLILELALEPFLVRLQNLIQRDLQLIRMDEATTPDPYLELDVTYGLLTGKARLFLFTPLDGPVPPAFRALGELLGQLPREMRKLSPELPVIVAGEIGSLRVTLALLRQTHPGDALLPDAIPFARGQIILTADRLWAPAEIAGDKLILRGPFRSQPHPLKCAHMTTQSETPQPPAEADIDGMEITLVFECGRWPIPLGMLRSVNEGHVFELGRPLDGPVDILANGRCIGRGDIVRVGEELAVRLRGRLAVND
ncbi:type III secretion system cytoplasmic ring protein SctQ [Bradyrhizobium macuxiense]|nr:type III secretion system cytoplasmic ring protein SctQ [Bradyrhizobium macuxiense]